MFRPINLSCYTWIYIFPLHPVLWLLLFLLFSSILPPAAFTEVFSLSVHKRNLCQDTTLKVHQARDSGSKCGPDSPQWHLYLIPLEVDPAGSINLLWGPHQTCNTCTPLARYAPGSKSLADKVECRVYKRCHLLPGEWWLAFHLLKWNYILHSNDLPVERMMCTLLWLCENAARGQMFSLNTALCSVRGLELITVTGQRNLSSSDPIFECFQRLLYTAFYCSGMKNQCELQRRSPRRANWEAFRGQFNPSDLSSESTESFHTLTNQNHFKCCASTMGVYSTQ